MGVSQKLSQIKEILKNNRLVSIILIISSILLICLVIVLLFSSSKAEDENNPERRPSEQLTNQIEPPVLKFDRYINNGDIKPIPPRVKAFTLKSDFTDDQIMEVAGRLGLNHLQPTDSEYVIVTETQDFEKRGLLAFHRPSGSFSYDSYGELRPQSYIGNNPKQVAQTLLDEIGVLDSTVTCDITYQKKLHPEMTYVECHRDWNLAGLPIYNMVGIINTPLTTQLTSMQVGHVDSDSLNDESIINVSTGINATGKVRPNDFNTVTVGVRNDGTVMSIVSNLRLIDQERDVLAAQLLRPEEAISLIENGESELSLTLPLGSGRTDWNKVYQNNEAVAATATITEISLSYLEKLPGTSQQHLVPMYTIRGQAKLSTGYNVAFTHTVPAMRDKTSFLTVKPESKVISWFTKLYEKLFANTYAQENKPKLQLGTFEPEEITPTSVPAQEQPTPQPELPPEDSEQFMCEPLSGITVELDIPGLGKLTVVQQHRSSTLASGVDSSRFYYQSATFPIESLDEAKQHFFTAVEEQFVINVAKYFQTDRRGSNATTPSGVKSSFRSMNGGSCPISQLHAKGDAPYFECERTEQIDNVGFNYEKSEEVANNVANRIAALVSEGKIGEYASKPDVFPKNIKNLNWVFVDNSRANLSKLSRFTDDCYITGGTPNSPAIFVYSNTKSPISIQPSKVMYAYPSLSERWSVFANSDGELTYNDRNFQYLYYEYDGDLVSYPENNLGYIVRWDEVELTVQNSIISKLGLKSLEADALLTDVKNALYDKQKTKYVKISLVDKNELDSQLPLKVSPTPDTVHRIHLELTPQDYLISISEPQITRLHRSNSTLVELGVYFRG